MDLLHVISLDLNAFLPTTVQTVHRIAKFFAWNIEVYCSTNFLLQRVPILEYAATQELLQPREESEISWCEVGRVRWVGKKLIVESLNCIHSTPCSMRSRVIVQEKSWCWSVAPLVSDVLLQVAEGLNVSVAVDSRPFAQELDPQRSRTVEEKCEHHLSTVLVKRAVRIT